MRKLRIGFLLFLLISGGFFLFKFTHALFSSSSSSNNNVFSASESFPTTIPSVTETVTISPSPTPSPALTNHLVISEVQINGATASQDFVELYNPTNSTVDLNGWKLRKRTSTGSESSLVVIETGKSIPAYGFFLWSNNANGYDSTIGADVSNGNTLAGDNSVALLKPDNTIIDQFAWGNGLNQLVELTAYPNNPGSGQSVERKAYSSSTASSLGSGGSDELKGNGFDSDNNSNDFILRSTSQPQNSNSPIESP